MKVRIEKEPHKTHSWLDENPENYLGFRFCYGFATETPQKDRYVGEAPQAHCSAP